MPAIDDKKRQKSDTMIACVVVIVFLVFTAGLVVFATVSYNIRIHELGQLSTDVQCMECCISGAWFNCEDQCNERINCTWEKASSVTNAKIEKVIEDEIFPFKQDHILTVGKAIDDFDKLNSVRREFTALTFDLPRPSAHLVSGGQPSLIEGNEYRMHDWQWRQGAEESFYRGVDYNPETGVVTIKEGGRYNVHIHTTFQYQPSTSGTSKVCQRLKKGCEMEDREEKTVTEEKRLLLGGDNPCSSTLDSSAIVVLDKNDTLVVEYQMPEDVDVGEAYFGLFLI